MDDYLGWPLSLLVRCAGCGLVHRRSQRRMVPAPDHPGRFIFGCPLCGSEDWHEEKEATT